MKKNIILFIIVIFIMLLIGCENRGQSEVSISSGIEMAPTNEFVIYRPPITPDWFSKAILLFRQAYPDVNIKIEDFSTGEISKNIEEYQSRVHNELLVGEGPDLIFPFYLNLNMHKSMQNGTFLNLSPYFDRDKTFCEDDFLPGVFNAGKYQGCQYIVPIHVIFPEFIARTPMLDKYGIVQIEDANIDSFLWQIGQASLLAEEDSNFDQMMDRTNYFPFFLRYANLQFLDYENHRVCPEPEKIRSFIDAYKQYYKWDYNDGKYAESMSAGELLPTDCCFIWAINQPYDFRVYSAKILDIDDGYTDIFVRDMDGRLTVHYQDYVAVPSTSKNQMNAYRFIQILLSEYTQAEKRNIRGTEVYMSNYCAVNQKALNTRCNDRIDDADIVFYDSTYTKVLDRVANIPRTEMIDHLNDLLKVETSCLDYILVNFVWESMCPYFKDEKSYEACFEELKSKLLLYLDE